MVIHMESPRVARVTVTLDPTDVDLLDRVAKLSGSNRSIELRSILAQLRPTLRATVEAMEGVVRSREALEVAAATATGPELEALMREAEKLQDQFLGAMARVEGAAAVAGLDPRSSNTGVTPPHPPTKDADS